MSSRINDTTQSKAETAVLYLDHKAKPTPITKLYHATASRHLTSPDPPSSITEVESAYCAQCLQFWDAKSAFDSENCGGVCQNKIEDNNDEEGPKKLVGCTSCPSCSAVLHLTVQTDYGFDDEKDKNNDDDGDESKLIVMYACGYCHWNTLECNLSVPLPNNDEGLLEECSLKLQTELSRRLEAQSLATDWLVKSSIKGWNKKNQLDKTELRDNLLPPEATNSFDLKLPASSSSNDMGKKSSRRNSIMDGLTSATGTRWSIDIMEKTLKERRERMKEGVLTNGIDLKTQSPSLSLGTWNKLSISSVNTAPKDEGTVTKDQTIIPTATQNARQSTISSSNIKNTIQNESGQTHLLPVPIPLRSRFVRRCNAEIKTGRPGILVKPKVNPLEGDGSLRFGHGQWWKKDCSAIHILPRVEVHKYGYTYTSNDDDDGEKRFKFALLLEIKNPTLGMVRLRLTRSNSQSKTTPTFARGSNEDSVLPEKYQQLVIDSMTLQTIDAKVLNLSTEQADPKTSEKMDFITFEPVEDAFLELGKGQSRDPQIVEEWNSDHVLENINEKEDTLSFDLKMIAQEKDRAWIECIVTAEMLSIDDEEDFLTIPLDMDIEVDGGSWESAWIRPLSAKKNNDDVDYVSFTILPVWKVSKEGHTR